MNRTDRLLAIVLELQAKRWQRAEDLAATFETSKRTIYRDIQALGEAGVPVVSIPGRGLSLVEGYFLPPISFTGDEAAMLLLGAELVGLSFDEHLRDAAESGSRKISGVLPDAQRAAVEAVRESIHFVRGGPRTGETEKLRVLRRAIFDRRTVRFAYFTRAQPPGEMPVSKTRDVNPYSLANVGGTWYLTGFDALRSEVRTFRLDRIEELTLLDRTFTRPPALDPALRRRIQPELGVTVRALFDADVARWVRESPNFFTTAMDDTPEGLLVTLMVRTESDVLQWILGWGRAARVLEPASLRELVATEAAAMLAHACDSRPS